MNLYFFHAATLAVLSFVIYQLVTVGRQLMSTQQTIDTVVGQLVKARTEIVAAKDALVAKIVDLQNQIDAGVPVEEIDLSGLQEVAQSLDDINPDPVVEIPVEEPPVEEPVEVPVEEVPAEPVQDEPPF